jgi:hypothetical protein
MRLKLKVNLTPQRAKAYSEIDFLVEQVRLRIVTPGSGQAMAYQQKYEEALAFVADPTVDPSEVPHIYGEVGITAPTAAEVAQVILNLRSMWRDVSAQLEHLRLSAKQTVENAVTAEGIGQAVEAAKLQLAALPSG